MELHHLGVMRLAAADDGSTRLCHQLKIADLLRAGARVVAFIPLERGDHNESLSLQGIDHPGQVLEVTRRCAGLEIGGGREAADIRFVAADEGDFVAIDLEERRLERIFQVEAAAEIRETFFVVDLDRFAHPGRAAVGEVIACQLDHVRTDIGQQVDIFRVTAKDQRSRIGFRKGTASEKGDFVADMGNVCFPKYISDFFTRVGNALSLHRIGGGADKRGHTGHDDRCHFGGIVIG